MNKKIVKIIILVVISLVVGFLFGYYLPEKNINKDTDPSLSEHENRPAFNGEVLIIDGYKEYISYVDKICPFYSTAVTSDCLDQEIKKQDKEYDLLAKELLKKANLEAKELESQGEPVYPEINNVLNTISEYSTKRSDNMQLLCSVKNVLIGGTAIAEESRKCWMYYNSKDIEMLEELISKY